MLHGGKNEVLCQEPPDPEELDALLRSPHPFVLTVIGVGGLTVILWLMMFKPF